MFSNVGWGEILLILIVGLVLIGPERLPHIITDVRAMILAARTAIDDARQSITGEFGEDFDDLKYYQPGDRISDIDWKATARSGEPLIRQFNEERVRHLSIVADTSSAMAATAADGTSKRDAMVMAAGMICYLAQKNGDLVGLVAGDDAHPVQLPARSSTVRMSEWPARALSPDSLFMIWFRRLTSMSG